LLFLLYRLVDIADLRNLLVNFSSLNILRLFIESVRRGIQNIQQSVKAVQDRIFRQAALRLRRGKGRLVPQRLVTNDRREWRRKSFDLGEFRNGGEVGLLG